MRVLGLMSGTSADGIDVALVRIRGRGSRLRARLEKFCTVPYPPSVRRAVLRVANANRAPILSVAEISQLNFLLGEMAAKAILRACRRFRVPLKSVDLVGSHGQTVYHQGKREVFAGHRLASTLQLGEAAVIAERTGLPVVANFRPRDIAASGQGAPLVPYVDYLLYRHPRRGRVALNIGGIANVTAIPAAAWPEQIVAFDTGPGNMLIDAVVERVMRSRRRFDRGGALAAKGRPDYRLVRRLLRHPYFLRRPPKSTGREQFGAACAEQFLRAMKGASFADRARTATELTVRSIADAFQRFLLPRMKIDEVILGGGGARNRFLVRRLEESLPRLTFSPAGRLGVEEKAKEAFAFAVLAYLTWKGEPGTLPAATGAQRSVVLGTIVPGRRASLPGRRGSALR
jgi:anhydro-N-acetylmuramic acid kinase